MSGSVKSNVFGTSGTIAAAAGGLKWEAVVTASTVTVESNRGYFINTTSNACTVTLPASPGVGDQIILLDYARTWDTNAVTIDSNGNDFQNSSDAYVVDYDTEGQGLNIVFSGSTIGWIPNSDVANALTAEAPVIQRGIFGFGANDNTRFSLTNLVNSSGVVAADVTGVGTIRQQLSAASYGYDKGIFRGGYDGDSKYGLSNLINNLGVVAADVAKVGDARVNGAAASYGAGLAIFAFGESGGSAVNDKNLVNINGVVAADATGAGTARAGLAAAGYGGDKAIFAFGSGPSDAIVNTRRLVNSSGTVASDANGVGTVRYYPAATGYSNVAN